MTFWAGFLVGAAAGIVALVGLYFAFCLAQVWRDERELG